MTTHTHIDDDLIPVDPHGPSLRQVERLLRDKDFSEAIRVCHESLELKPEPKAEVEWRLLLGRAYLMSGQAQ